jgi:IMP dehydrogenase/GMP reductase
MKIRATKGLTFEDVLLIPVVSANMDTVTEARHWSRIKP